MNHRCKVLLILVILVMEFPAARAATPCDFKGLSVGNHMTPRQIMQHFGIRNFSTEAIGAHQSPKEAAASMRRMKAVGIMNEMEEEEFRRGPSCGPTSCVIPYGFVGVGNEPYATMVGVSVFFDSQGRITATDIVFDKSEWDTVRELINTKYGDDWEETNSQDVTSDYEKKKSWLDTVTILKHRRFGTNRKTGDQCKISVVSRDVVFVHTTPPALRSIMEISLVSTNF
jgi:hypothetical protein